MTERWLPVVGAEGAYEISDRGRCRSVDRLAVRGEGTYSVRGKVLSATLSGHRSKNRHYSVELKINGVHKRRTIHTMMLESFVGPRPLGMQGLHWDDVSTNNVLDNLRWGTRSDNSNDKVRNGRDHQTVKTECPWGHEYTPENTVRWGVNGGRRCRHCETDRKRATRASRTPAMR